MNEGCGCVWNRREDALRQKPQLGHPPQSLTTSCGSHFGQLAAQRIDLCDEIHILEAEPLDLPFNDVPIWKLQEERFTS